jgi:hypothetical protein
MLSMLSRCSRDALEILEILPPSLDSFLRSAEDWQQRAKVNNTKVILSSTVV